LTSEKTKTSPAQMSKVAARPIKSAPTSANGSNNLDP